MRTTYAFLLVSFFFCLTSCSTCKKLTYIDVSPNSPNYDLSVQSSPSTGGIVLNMAGNTEEIFAVSRAAGVWMNKINGSTKLLGPWTQLPNSSRYAYCIAVDPKNHRHLVVGDREGDKSNIANNQCGIWESRDEGDSWRLTFNPMTLRGCNSHQINQIAFDNEGNIYAATNCGIVVQSSTSNDYKLILSSSQIITNVVAGESNVWAKDFDGRVFRSIDHGVTFQQPTTKPLPAGIFFNSSDHYSFAAFDEYAYLTASGEPTKLNDEGVPENRYSVLVVYSADKDEWIVQQRINDMADGTGNGGRRFVKSFILGSDRTIGSGRRLYYSDAQGVSEATAKLQDETMSWNQVAYSSVSGTTTSLGTHSRSVHADLWDFLNPGDRLLIAGDGGIFEWSPTVNDWFSVNDGLHIHLIHSFTGPNPCQNDLHLFYATQDNSGWYRYDKNNQWGSDGTTGDANWVLSDQASWTGSIIRQSGFNKSPCNNSVLTTFGASPVNSCYIFCNDNTVISGECQFSLIQTPFFPSTISPPVFDLDAVMLVNLPLQYRDNGTLVNVTGPTTSSTGLALVRNQQFILTKDINTFKGSGWKPSGTSLPGNTIGFRVSGGHDNPIFYLYASDGTVWKGSGSSWQKLNVKGNLTDAQPWPQQNVVGTMSQIGLFVNPYQANTIYCLTNEGVYYSFDGGNSFSKDDILTSLVTDNNSYPITANYQGFTNFNPLIGFAGFPARCTISAVAFNRQQPDEVVVASSFSGLFYRKDKTSAWVNLTDKLPTPYCPITGASLTNDGIYVAFRGRGVVKLLSKK